MIAVTTGEGEGLGAVDETDATEDAAFFFGASMGLAWGVFQDTSESQVSVVSEGGFSSCRSRG